MRRVALLVFVVLASALVIAGAVALASNRGGDAPPAGRQLVPAPIDQLDVLVRESAPPLLTVKIRAGLPSGCAKQDSHSTSVSGDVITITVLNSMPTGNPICTAIYGTYELSVDVSGLAAGRTYTVRVNDKVTSVKT
jgi:hypothetical protein